METWTKTCGLPLLFNFEPHPPGGNNHAAHQLQRIPVAVRQTPSEHPRNRQRRAEAEPCAETCLYMWGFTPPTNKKGRGLQRPPPRPPPPNNQKKPGVQFLTTPRAEVTTPSRPFSAWYACRSRENSWRLSARGAQTPEERPKDVREQEHEEMEHGHS